MSKVGRSNTVTINGQQVPVQTGKNEQENTVTINGETVPIQSTQNTNQDSGGSNMGLLGGIGDAIFGGTPSPPPAPDFERLAELEAEQNLEFARSQTQANRPNEFNPYGSRLWEQDPDNPDQWSTTTALSEPQQGIFDTNQMTDQQMADLGLSAAGQTGDVFSSRFQVGDSAPGYEGQGPLQDYGSRRQDVVDAMMARTNTDISRDRETVKANLVAQGIPVGSEAYNRAMEQIDRKQTDARQQADINATNIAGQEYSSYLKGRGVGGQEAMDEYSTGLESHRQGVTDALLERQTPLNEMNALRSGAQVGTPDFGGYGQQQFTPGTDFTGAAQNQFGAAMDAYNADVANQNSYRTGLVTLGASYLSDRKLKDNIKQIGELESGLPVYEFNYKGDDTRYTGVMADEVEKVFPDAVSHHESGYKMVNYGAIS